MKVNVLYGDEYIDIIEIPYDNMDIESVHYEFVRWVQREDSEYKIAEGDWAVFSYGIDVFIDWLNENYFKTGNKAKVLIRSTQKYDKEDVSIDF